MKCPRWEINLNVCNSLSSQPLLGIVRKVFLLEAPSLRLSCEEHFAVQVAPYISCLALPQSCWINMMWPRDAKGFLSLSGPGCSGEHKDGFPRQQLMSLATGRKYRGWKESLWRAGINLGGKNLNSKITGFLQNIKLNRETCFWSLGNSSWAIRNKNPS